MPSFQSLPHAAPPLRARSLTPDLGSSIHYLRAIGATPVSQYDRSLARNGNCKTKPTKAANRIPNPLWRFRIAIPGFLTTTFFDETKPPIPLPHVPCPMSHVPRLAPSAQHSYSSP